MKFSISPCSKPSLPVFSPNVKTLSNYVSIYQPILIISLVPLFLIVSPSDLISDLSNDTGCYRGGG